MKSFILCLMFVSLSLTPCLTACTSDPPLAPTVTAAATATATITATPTITVSPRPVEVTPTPTPTLVAVDPQPSATVAPTPDGCPGADFMYQLNYVHEVVQTMPNVLIESRAEPNAAFYFVVHENRQIDSANIDNQVQVNISGTIQGCTLVGSGDLTADITGECRGGMAYIHVVESWRELTTTTTCPGSDPQTVQIEGMFSAPEDNFVLDINQEGDSYILEADIEILSAYYSWTLFEYGVWPVPIPHN